VTLRDELTGARHAVRAGAVINATGVWAGELVGDVRLRPSRGTHLVLRREARPGLQVALILPVPGARNRFLNVLPAPDGLFYVGLTDEPVDDVPDVPHPSADEITFLRDTVSAALDVPLEDDDVVGAFAGLRPLLEAGGPEGHSADLSRRHAVLTSPDGVVTVVGGKLTTYRRMAEDAVDAAVSRGSLRAGPCRTARLPLAGATSRSELTRLATAGPSTRLVRRYGADAPLVVRRARDVTGLADEDLLAPVADDVAVTLAELVFGVTDEGAHDADDLLERRTRVGLVALHRSAAEAPAARALEVAAPPVG
jgi:glycerol-3-phosphate dehydrogenase